MIFKIIQDNIHLLKAHNLDWEFFSPSDGGCHCTLWHRFHGLIRGGGGESWRKSENHGWYLLVASGVTDQHVRPGHPHFQKVPLALTNSSFIRTSMHKLPNARGREALRRIILQFFHVKYTSQAKNTIFVLLSHPMLAIL